MSNNTIISYTIFSELRNSYTSWESLKEYLESSDGGLLKILSTSNPKYKIIRYEKGVSKFNVAHVPYFRSVIWNINENIPVCVAPIKATNNNFPYNTLEECINNEVVCEEFLEGFMINVFKTHDDIYISSRSKLDATGRFYSTRTFKDLFTEAYLNTNYHGVQSNDINITDLLNGVIVNPDMSRDEVAIFYSYIVQHPEHRIVKNINELQVHKVISGTVYNNGKVVINKLYDTIPQIRLTEYDGAMSVNDFKQMIFTENGWGFQGIVFTDKNGNRWRYRSDKFMSVKSLRGNSSNMLTRYAQLVEQNLTKKYLEYYPEDEIYFSFFNLYFTVHVTNLFELYQKLHIYKSITRDEINKMYLPHLYNIHGYYLTNLRSKGEQITINDVMIYLRKQPWQRISFLIKMSFIFGNNQTNNINEVLDNTNDIDNINNTIDGQ
jgi:hypothetical protein